MAKRIVKKVDFSQDSSHVAIVGSPANGEEVLLMKTKTELKKAEEVKITTSMTTFLNAFFGLWHEDANELAALLGYEVQEWYYDLIGEDTEVEILKSATEETMVHKQTYENLKKARVEFNKLKKQKEKIMAKEKDVDLQKQIDDAVAVALEKEKTEKAELQKKFDEEKIKNEELSKAALKKEKDEMVELCKGYSFAEDADKLADSLFLCKGIEGFDLILETLEKARIALKEALEKEIGSDEEKDLQKDKTDNTPMVDKTSELIKARYTKETK